MNILHINTFAGGGGAANAMWTLHCGIMRRGVNSRILVDAKAVTDENIFLISEATKDKIRLSEKVIEHSCRALNRVTGLAYWFYPSTFALADTDIFRWADIVHFHNLHGGYFNPKAIPLISRKKTVVWTLHDMWAFTGHCAYAYGCRKWLSGCGGCPVFKDPAIRNEPLRATIIDLTALIWKTRRRIYAGSSMHIVTPSKWLSFLAKESILSGQNPIETIPNGVDLSVFCPSDSLAARSRLGIGRDERVLLFISEDLRQYRKGWQYLVSAIERLGKYSNICLLLVGAGAFTISKIRGVRVKEIGYARSQELMHICYNAADLLVLPTLSDNLPLTIIEAMACGLPAVAFEAGGIPELIRHMDNGFIAEYKSSASLAEGIQLLLDDGELLLKMKQRCRELSRREYDMDLECARYLELYNRLMGAAAQRRVP